MVFVARMVRDDEHYCDVLSVGVNLSLVEGSRILLHPFDRTAKKSPYNSASEFVVFMTLSQNIQYLKYLCWPSIQNVGMSLKKMRIIMCIDICC